MARVTGAGGWTAGTPVSRGKAFSFPAGTVYSPGYSRTGVADAGAACKRAHILSGADADDGPNARVRKCWARLPRAARAVLGTGE